MTRPCIRFFSGRSFWLIAVLAAPAVAGLLVTSGSGSALAQDPLPVERKNYTPLDAGADAYHVSEAQRAAEIGRQLGLNNRLRSRYAYSYYGRPWFEPWPLVPGDIWGYPLLSPIRQSVGQRSYQAGPNRWISEPVYEDQLTDPKDAAPASGAVPSGAAASGSAPQMAPAATAPQKAAALRMAMQRALQQNGVGTGHVLPAVIDAPPAVMPIQFPPVARPAPQAEPAPAPPIVSGLREF